MLQVASSLWTELGKSPKSMRYRNVHIQYYQYIQPMAEHEQPSPSFGCSCSAIVAPLSLACIQSLLENQVEYLKRLDYDCQNMV